MNFIDFLILGVGCITFFEGARRLDLLALAAKQSEKITNKSETGNQENSLSYRILLNPMSDTNWKPGIGAAINERPFVIFLLIILVLAAISSVLAFVPNYSRMSFLLMVLAFSFAFHSGPDTISAKERYLEIIVSQNPGKLNGHDLRILTKTSKEYHDWPLVQLAFGLLFATTIFLPDWFFFTEAVFLLLIGLVYLGWKYSITKGIYASAPGI
ncbi:MAG: hypothetical protein BV458_10440 [Thermoplasmata archaeon M9B2D]|nr:MAG: hypothetical protein BV458_10440 [Thermoplasmata archaeon M9B2D]